MKSSKILFSFVLATSFLSADEFFWSKKYDDIVKNLENTSGSQKDMLLKQAQDYERAKNAENIINDMQNVLNKNTLDYNNTLQAYNIQLGIFNTLSTNLNDKQKEKSQNDNLLLNLNSNILKLQEQNQSLGSLKTDFETKNDKLLSNIVSYENQKADFDALLNAKQSEYNMQNQKVLDAYTELESVKNVHFDLVRAYNEALKKAGDEQDAEVKATWLKLKESDDKVATILDKYNNEKASLDSIDKAIKNINLEKNKIDLSIQNAQNSILANKTEVEKINNQISSNIQNIGSLENQVSLTSEKINTIEQELQALSQDKNTQKELLELKNQELTNAKIDLEKTQQSLNNAKKDLENIILSMSDTQKHIKQITTNIGEFVNDASDDTKNLILLMATNPNLSDPNTKQQVQNIANKIADKIIDKQKQSVQASSSGATLVQLNNMTKRLGEIRSFDINAGAWVRGYGGKYSNDDSHFYYYSTQVGADNMLDIGYNSKLLVGGLVGFDKINADTKTKSYSIGGYASYLHDNGSFLDFVLKYVNTSHDRLNHSIKNQNSVLASLEAGHRFGIYDFYVEPSFELISGYVGKYEDEIGKSTTISIDGYVPFLLKSQIYFGGVNDDFVYRAGVGAVIDTQNQKASISIDEIVSGISASSNAKLDKNSYGFVSVGGSYKISNDFIVNLGVERSFGGNLVNDYEMNMVLRYSF